MLLIYFLLSLGVTIAHSEYRVPSRAQIFEETLQNINKEKNTDLQRDKRSITGYFVPQQNVTKDPGWGSNKSRDFVATVTRGTTTTIRPEDNEVIYPQPVNGTNNYTSFSPGLSANDSGHEYPFSSKYNIKHGYPGSGYPSSRPAHPYPTSKPVYPTHSNVYPVFNNGYPWPNNGFSAPSSGYLVINNGNSIPINFNPAPNNAALPVPNTAYPAQTDGYTVVYPSPYNPASAYGYPAISNVYPGFNNGYPWPNNGFSAPSSDYLVINNGNPISINFYPASLVHTTVLPSPYKPATYITYPATSNGYPATSNGYTATSNGYPATSNGYPATSNGYPATSNGYPATSNGYPPTNNVHQVPNYGNPTTNKPGIVLSGSSSYSTNNNSTTTVNIKIN